MWYEIIPPLLIATVGLYLPGAVFTKLINKASHHGNPYGRDVLRADMRLYVKRDHELNNGDEYKFVGLEAIKDSK